VQHQENLSKFDGGDTRALAALHVAHFAEMNNPQAHPLDAEALVQLGFANAMEWIEDPALLQPR
jgi:hypothetical protein